MSCYSLSSDDEDVKKKENFDEKNEKSGRYKFITYRENKTII